MFRGFGSVFYKEVIQISRDPLTLLLMMGMPMIQLLVFGYAINTDVRNIKTAVYNLDPGPQSRELLHAFENLAAGLLYLIVTPLELIDDRLARRQLGQKLAGVSLPYPALL